MSAKIIQLFTNVHMGMAHQGLSTLAKKHKKNPEKLEPGEVLMFINRKHDKLKVLGPQGVLAYLRMPSDQRITLDAIQYIPRCLGGGGEINYNDALKMALVKTMEKRAEKSEGTRIFT